MACSYITSSDIFIINFNQVFFLWFNRGYLTDALSQIELISLVLNVWNNWLHQAWALFYMIVKEIPASVKVSDSAKVDNCEELI